MEINDMNPTPNIQIVPFTNETATAIKSLNYEWLQKYFRVEDHDVTVLSNPKAEIIDKGGYIFYAKQNDNIIGTASLLKITDDNFELSKMAVTESAQGLGIGTLLIEHCLAFAKEKGMGRLILYSNTALTPAIGMYRKYGFTEIELEDGVYERADIKMEKRLEDKN